MRVRTSFPPKSHSSEQCLYPGLSLRTIGQSRSQTNQNDIVLPLGIIFFLLIGGMALAQDIPKGRNQEACLECAASADSREHSGMNVEAPGSTGASLSISPDSWTLRKRVDEVIVFFAATHWHKFAQGLNREDIRVTDDDKPVEKISAFGYQRDLPLRLGLLVDTSGSVNPQFRAQQSAAVQFLQEMVRRGRDRAFVMGFANHTVVTQDYSDDPEHLAAGVAALHNGGGTALFDAIQGACNKLTTKEDGVPTARILVVLSDFDDDASETTLLQAITKAQMREVTIYTMNTANPEQNYLAMKRLAAETGGLAFDSIYKGEVTSAFSAIEKEMRNRYMISYQPLDLKEDGRFHHIRIRAEKSGERFHVHTRTGYYARLESSTE